MGPIRSTIMAVLAVITCLASGAREASAEEPSRSFSHRTHKKAAPEAKCAGCHTEGAKADQERPAKQTHAACDAKGCHADEFFSKKMAVTDLCLTCHISSDWKALEKGRANIRAFPRGHSRLADATDPDRTYLEAFDYYAEFSHKKHLAKGGPVPLKSGDDGCLSCHAIRVEGGRATVVRPGHEQCVTCHDGQAKAPKSKMSDCDACHVFRRSETGELAKMGPISRLRRGRVSGQFDHEKHRLDRRKSDSTPTSCGACHSAVVNAEKLGEIQVTTGQSMMQTACKKCHDGRQRTASGRPIFDITGQCTLCHAKNFLDDGASAPPKSHR